MNEIIKLKIMEVKQRMELKKQSDNVGVINSCDTL